MTKNMPKLVDVMSPAMSKLAHKKQKISFQRSYLAVQESLIKMSKKSSDKYWVAQIKKLGEDYKRVIKTFK